MKTKRRKCSACQGTGKLRPGNCKKTKERVCAQCFGSGKRPAENLEPHFLHKNRPNWATIGGAERMTLDK